MNENQERKDVPALVFKDLPLMGEPIKIKLDCATPVKTGESQYGTWNMWFGFVENANVTVGRKPNQTKQTGYSGKVLFFPSAKLNEELIKAANGNLEVEVSVKKTAKEGARGLMTIYEVEKLSEGKPSQSQLTPSEINLLNDFEALAKTGFTPTESDFINASQELKYGGQISVLRAKELFSFLKK